MSTITSSSPTSILPAIATTLAAPTHTHIIALILLMPSSLVLTSLPPFALYSALGLWCVIFSVFRESHCNTLTCIPEFVTQCALHRILRRLLTLIVHECNPLSILITCLPNLSKAHELLEYVFQVLLPHIGWYVTYIQTHHLLGLRF